MTAYVDFETRSECDLPKKGAYNYAQDGSTEVLCMAYAFDDEDVQLWLPGQPLPDFTGHRIYAHNAGFERLIFWYVLQQDYPLEQFYCTAAQARANCLPGSLEDVGRALSSKMRKDYRGSELVRKCCCPPFNTELLPELYDYCLQDVRTMREISKAMRPLSEQELADYHTNERINDRGVLVDVDLCKAAIRYSDAELEEVQQIFREITGLASVRSPKMRQWVQERVGPEALKLMTVYKKGEKKMSVDKNVRAALLILAEETPDEVPYEVADVLQCADDVWASSVAKFSRLQTLADEEDHRVRGAFVFAGGSATGRASSYGAQVHNFTRKCAGLPEDVRHAMVRGHQIVPTYGKRITDVLKGMLRPALIPAKGNVFVVADWSAIEGRVTPWLAHNAWSEDKLDIFRSGRDPYKVNAEQTFNVRYNDVTDDQRQIGKVQELALGFSGGVGAFASMGRAYDVLISESEAQRMVQGWRRANPWAMPYWQNLEATYRRALRNKGKEFSVGRVTYLYDGQHLWYLLPSGRVLCYPFAKFEGDEITYLKAAWKPAADATEWPRARLWRGLACIAKGTPVLTDMGWVPIEQVSTSLRVWDGEGWVTHSGVAHQGYGEVCYTFGVATTRDHLILTTEGWKRADEIQGHHRASGKPPHSYEDDRLGRTPRSVGDSLRLRADASNEIAKLHEVGEGKQGSVLRVYEKTVAIRSYDFSRDEPASGICGVAKYASSLYSPLTSRVEKLRRTRGNCVRTVAEIVRKLLAGYGAKLRERFVPGSYRQQSWVFARELSMGNISTASTKYSENTSYRLPAWFYDCIGVIGKNGGRENYSTLSDETWSDWCRPDIQTRFNTEVFDLINCGPNRRFVVQGVDGRPVIVHNCENITQATANDLLRESLRQIDDVVLHIHDEIVVECKDSAADYVKAEAERIMCIPPTWAEGLPLAVNVKIMKRYGK